LESTEVRAFSLEVFCLVTEHYVLLIEASKDDSKRV